MFFRYHTGTLAFGSLIIAIIKMIRMMLQYIQDKLEEKGADNPVVKVQNGLMPLEFVVFVSKSNEKVKKTFYDKLSGYPLLV